MDIGRQHLDRDRIEPVLPAGHHPVLRRENLPGNRFPAAAIEPDRVTQIGCSERAVALAIRSVTRCTIGCEQLRPGRVRSRLATQRQNVVGDLGDFRPRQNTLESRHHADAGLIIALLPYAMHQRILDRRKIAAPQPVIVVEIGVAGRSRRAGTVALHAIDPECCASTGHRLLHQFAIFG